jgi:hypothetical protein
VDDDTEEYGVPLPMGNADGTYPLILSIALGEYIIFPDGIKAFTDAHKAEALSIDPTGHIWALRTGLADKMDWVQLTVNDTEVKKEKKTNG